MIIILNESVAYIRQWIFIVRIYDNDIRGQELDILDGEIKKRRLYGGGDGDGEKSSVEEWSPPTGPAEHEADDTHECSSATGSSSVN